MLLELSKIQNPDHLKEIEKAMNGLKEKGHLRTPNLDPNEYGLYYDINYLNSLGLENIHLPVEYQALFADAICKAVIADYKINSPKEREKLENELATTILIVENVNATSIGNMAYCYLNIENENSKKHLKILLEAILSHEIKKYIVDLKEIVKRLLLIVNKNEKLKDYGLFLLTEVENLKNLTLFGIDILEKTKTLYPGINKEIKDFLENYLNDPTNNDPIDLELAKIAYNHILKTFETI